MTPHDASVAFFVASAALCSAPALHPPPLRRRGRRLQHLQLLPRHLQLFVVCAARLLAARHDVHEQQERRADRAHQLGQLRGCRVAPLYGGRGGLRRDCVHHGRARKARG